MGSNERRLLRNKINQKLSYMANKEAKENNFVNSSQLITVRQQMYMAIAQNSRSKDNSRISKKNLPFPIETSSLPHVNVTRINRLLNSTKLILNNSEEIDKVIKAHSFRIATPYYTNPDLTVERGNFMNYSKHIGALLQTPYYINYLKTLSEPGSSKGSQKPKYKKSISRQTSDRSSNSIRTSVCLEDSISLNSESTIAKTSSKSNRSDSMFVPRSKESTSASMSVSNTSKHPASSLHRTESHTSPSLVNSPQGKDERISIVSYTNEKKDGKKKPRESKIKMTQAHSITKSTSGSYKSQITSYTESLSSSKLESPQSKDNIENFENVENHAVKADLNEDNEAIVRVEILKSPILSEVQISSPKIEEYKKKYSQSNEGNDILFSKIVNEKEEKMLQVDSHKNMEIVPQHMNEETKSDVVQNTFSKYNERDFLKYEDKKKEEISETYYDQKQKTLSKKIDNDEECNYPDDNFYSDNKTDEEENKKTVSLTDFQRNCELLSQNTEVKRKTSIIQDSCKKDNETMFSKFDKSEKRLSVNSDHKFEASISQSSSRKGSLIKFPKFWVKDTSDIYQQVKTFLKEHQVTKEELHSMDRYFDTVHHFRHTRPAYVLDYCIYLNKQNIENVNLFTNIFNKEAMDSITTKDAIEIKNLLIKYTKKLKDGKEPNNQTLISGNEDVETAQCGNVLGKQGDKKIVNNNIELCDGDNDRKIPKNKVDEDDEGDFLASFRRLFRNSVADFTKDDIKSLKQLVSEYRDNLYQDKNITDDIEDEIIDFSDSFRRLFRNSSVQMNEDDIKAIQKMAENMNMEDQLILSDNEGKENDKVKSFRKLFRESIGNISESDLRVVRNTITNYQDPNNESSEYVGTKSSKNFMAFKDLFRNSISSIKENDLEKINKIIEDQEKTMTVE